MLSDKQVRMLQLLDKQVGSCRKCSLSQNGTAIPFWTRDSKYAIISEAPGHNEIRKKTPFMGAAGEILTKVLADVGFNAKDFLIINTVQCKPTSGRRNAKPNETQIEECQGHLRKYLKVIKPEKILCLGNYAKYLFTGNLQGVLRLRGMFSHHKLEGSETDYPVLFTIHPAYCIYNTEEGVPMLVEDINLFKKTEFERESEWIFSEDEFMII